jgi:hypothetical protein
VTYRQAGDQTEVVFTIAAVPFVAIPLIVVSDSADRIAHYIPFGTTYLNQTFPDGSPLPRVMTVDEFFASNPVLTKKTWKRHALVTTTLASAHVVRAWWTPEWVFGGWYVNLQEPLLRTLPGFMTEDHFLDILVAPDLMWTWKDEDELAFAVERGRLTPGMADSIRAEGEKVLITIERAQFPFDGSLVDWRPDPAWPVPELRSGWMALRETT